MKPRAIQMIAWILIVLALFLSAAFLTGCKSAEHHYAKFIKKGGKVHCDTVTISRLDTLWIEGKPVIVERPVTVIEKQVEYKTKWETKYRWKEKHDSVYLEKWKTKWKTKEVIKTEKIKEDSWWWLWYIIGFFTVPAIYLFIVLYIRRH